MANGEEFLLFLCLVLLVVLGCILDCQRRRRYGRSYNDDCCFGRRSYAQPSYAMTRVVTVTQPVVYSNVASMQPQVHYSAPTAQSPYSAPNHTLSYPITQQAPPNYFQNHQPPPPNFDQNQQQSPAYGFVIQGPEHNPHPPPFNVNYNSNTKQ